MSESEIKALAEPKAALSMREMAYDKARSSRSSTRPIRRPWHTDCTLKKKKKKHKKGKKKKKRNQVREAKFIC